MVDAILLFPLFCGMATTDGAYVREKVGGVVWVEGGGLDIN